MGVARGEMTLRGLALSIPPAFASLLVGQMAAQICHDRFGVPVFSAVHAKDNPQAAALLHRWEVGAGEANYTQGQAREPPAPQSQAESASDTESDADTEEEAVSTRLGRQPRHGHKASQRDRTPTPTLDWLSQLFYEDGGAGDQVLSPQSLPGLRGLISGARTSLPADHRSLVGKHTWCIWDETGCQRLLSTWQRAVHTSPAGTVLTMITVADKGSHLRRRLAKSGAVHVGTASDSRTGREITAWRVGTPNHRLPPTLTLSPEQMLAKLDTTDVTAVPDPVAKQRLQYAPYPVDWRAWQRLGYPPHIVERMRDGCQVPLSSEPPVTDFGQYPEKRAGDNWHVADEMQRSMRRGAMRWADPGEQATLIHPWVMVHKGAKVRACQDLSVGLNKLAPEKMPFSLPRVTDIRKWVQKDSYFVKIDLADGFWAVPIARHHQRLFGVRMPELTVTDADVAHPAAVGLQVGDRHPDSGRVALTTRCPFGWSLSPAAFCDLTEHIAEKMRDEHGINMVFFVDDALLVGTREECLRGQRILEAHLAELGLQVAPWKTEGPTRVVDFLGLTLCNLPGERSISLPRAKQEKLLGMIDNFMTNYSPGSRADPKDIAALLGMLNFAAQVVEPGQ